MACSFETYQFPVATINDIWDLFSYKSGSYLIYHKTPIDKNNQKTETQYIFHIYSNDFSRIQESIIQAKEIWNMDDSFQQKLYGKKQLNIAVVNPQEIICVHKFYDGKIYYFEFKGNKWQKRILLGEELNNPPYKILSRSKEPNKNRFGKYTMGFFGPWGKIYVNVNYLSKGLFILNDGKIIHFSTSMIDDTGLNLNVELFKKNGQLITTNIDIKNTSIKSEFAEVLCKDNRNNFYIQDIENEIPVIRVMELKIINK